jgi:hypothetical protein
VISICKSEFIGGENLKEKSHADALQYQSEQEKEWESRERQAGGV